MVCADEAAFSIGILLENMEGGSFTRDSEEGSRRKFWRWQFLFVEA
jgi:hypothetical protein